MEHKKGVSLKHKIVPWKGVTSEHREGVPHLFQLKGVGGVISWEAGGGDVVDDGDDGDDQDAADDDAAADDNDADVAVPDVVRGDADDEPAFGRESALGLLRSRAKMAYCGRGQWGYAPVGVDVDVDQMMLMMRMMVM